MKLTGLCLITEDVPRLVEFYSRVLNTQFQGDDSHSEAVMGGTSLVVYSRRAANDQLQFGLGEVRGTGNVTLMFTVEDVDGEYRRVRPLLTGLLTEPRTYPWGARSFHFFDPDGNIVDFVCPAHR